MRTGVVCIFIHKWSCVDALHLQQNNSLALCSIRTSGTNNLFDYKYVLAEVRIPTSLLSSSTQDLELTVHMPKEGRIWTTNMNSNERNINHILNYRWIDLWKIYSSSVHILTRTNPFYNKEVSENAAQEGGWKR